MADSLRLVLEVVSDHPGDTFRAVYTVRLVGGACVLHAFQKKSKRGTGTYSKIARRRAAEAPANAELPTNRPLIGRRGRTQAVAEVLEVDANERVV